MAGDQRDPLEHLLDDALATYVNRDPRPGLERRVLNRIRFEGARPRVPFLRWALPIAAVACLLAGNILWNHRAPAPAPPALVRTEASPAPAITAITQPAKPLRSQPGNGRPARTPKRTESPIRTALTHQERALVAFVRRAPDQALRAFGETQPVQIEPLRIDGMQLQPLQTSDGSK